MTRSRLVVTLAGALVVLLSGCSTIPDSGEVHTRPAGSQETSNQVPYFAPPGPADSDSQEGIVRGFLLAMQANPPSTAVARSFLSSRAKTTWKPSQGTIVYDAATVETVGNRVVAQIRGAHRLSPIGAWLDGTDVSTATIPLSLVQEEGQWRIDDPPNALAVPASYFSSLFVGHNLYFFDRTGTVLVPTRVYVPSGKETASNLVRGLLAGPPPAQRDVAVTAFPARAALDLGVVVNDAGIADVPLGPSVLELAPADLNRVVVQLAWTLRQVPGINRLRITVDGAPIPLADGRTDVRVGEGAEYDPLVSEQRELLAISDRRVVRDDDERGSAVSGPFGEQGFALRSLAWNSGDHLLAAVTANGRRVFVAPDRGARSPSRVDTALEGGTDLLRPAYDRFGGLWLVDNTASGAVVHHVRRGRDRVVRVPGVTGHRISAFTVTRDGTTFVASLASGSNPTVLVSSLVRDADGRMSRALPSRTLLVSGVDLGPARDLVQNGATTVAVLTRPASGADQVVYVELDGSPGPQDSPDSDPPPALPGVVASLVSNPDPALPLRAVSTDRHLFTLTDDGRWERAAMTDVVAAAYAQ
jgi:hypothetical protein